MSRLRRVVLAFMALALCSLALADPPARVGRLALAESGVNLRLDADDPGTPATINWPISSGAELDTDRRGRAEVWVGSTAFRLAGNSRLVFPVIDDRQVAVQLLDGTVAISVFERERNDELSLVTPEGRINFLTPGRYRIDAVAGHTELTVQAGQAAFSNAAGHVPVQAGQRASFYGGGQTRVEPDGSQDSFDYWVAERENAALGAASRRYVSPAMTGYQDLDANGDWRNSPEYGAVWYPRAVDADWAPYRYGRWAWVAPWGWTWVDQMSWGFAPFHYGRWVRDRERWGWVPGEYAARPVYAPALVAWIGNPGGNAAIRNGAAPAVGWFPLAPREVYVPGFHASNNYVRQLNVTQVRDNATINRAIQSGPSANYAYRALPQAVTVVPALHLREGRAITNNEIRRPDRRELERAPPARPTSDNAWLPPPATHQQREAAMTPGREPAPMPGAPRARESVPAPIQENEAGRGIGRQQLSPAPVLSAPVSRETERRSIAPLPPVQQAAPPLVVPAPVIERREPPAGREMQRERREIPRQFDATPRQRETPPPVQPSIQQVAPPVPHVAPVLQPQPLPTPAAQVRPAPDQRDKNRDENGKRHGEHDDNRGPH